MKSLYNIYLDDKTFILFSTASVGTTRVGFFLLEIFRFQKHGETFVFSKEIYLQIH